MATRKRTMFIAVGVAAALTLTAGGIAWAAKGNPSAAPAKSTVAGPLAALGAGEKVILDTDFGNLNDDSLSLFMLTQSSAEVLGVVTVTGNSWAQAGTAYALRQLERVERTDIPVVQGATDPLFGSRQDAFAAEDKLFGKRGWHGAWDDEEPEDYTKVEDVYDGAPTTKPLENTSGADFIVEQVKKHPGEVTLLAIGPLTNVAIAVKNHPEIVPLTKQIIYMGGAFDVPGNDGAPASEFNIWIDPEAARIAWAAPWPKQVIVPLDVTNTVQYGKDQYERIIAGADTTITRQFKDAQAERFEKNPAWETDVWDALAAALFLDPALITASDDRSVTVDTSYGLNYGRTTSYPAELAPPELSAATIVQRFDNPKFYDQFVGLLSAPVTT